jgi:hypothetical protein
MIISLLEITELVKKLKWRIRFFIEINLVCHHRKEIAQATFMSVLDYGDVLYMHGSASVLKKLDAVYHAVLRFVTGANLCTHHCFLYTSVGWDSLTFRRTRHWLILVFKAVSQKLPNDLNSKIQWSNSIYQTRSRDMLVLEIPQIH